MCKYRVGSSNTLRASSAIVLRASTAHTQSRSISWRGRRHWDWASQLDPIYQRYARIHTLKTRAKLLQKLRRRGSFQWDVDSKPFFTPRHLRWASHWKGRQWYTSDDPKQKVKDEAAVEGEGKRLEEDGYELSKREKEWKEQMEAMRKRIAQDPYEAIFGKRFEPFWSPLVPSWMREEMGLQGWPRDRIEEADKAAAVSDEKRKQVDELVSRILPSGTELPKNTSKPASTSSTSTHEASKPFSRMTKKERMQHVQQNAAAQSVSEPSTSRPIVTPTAYSYASSTFWDSTSNKTQKVEWDSESNQTKKFEYDPISNRMVEIQMPSKVAIDADSSAVRQSIVGEAPKSKVPTVASSTTPVGIPVKQSTDVRKAIPIPPPLSQPSHSITLGYTQTSVGPLKSTAISAASVKPAALAKLPAQDLDMLTADHVRASMGKVKDLDSDAKATTAEEKAELERAFDTNSRTQDAEVDAILKERSAGEAQTATESEWDRAERVYMLEREVDSLQKKKAKLIENEKGLFHIERQKRELQKLDERIQAVTERVDAMNTAAARPEDAASLRRSLALASEREGSPVLQSSVERMQSRDAPKVQEHDLDDAAAHESTEPIDAHATVPKEWTKAADLLQADRVKRTTSKRPYPMTRWVDDMNARKVAYEHEQAVAQAAEEAKNAASNATLEQLNKLLQAEVAEQKFRMQAFEGRYAQKVKSLRGELDTAFKQSSVHSEKHVERIRELEAQLSGLKMRETKYADKVKSLRDELERAYKQSAVHAEKHVERIRYLEGELETVMKKPVESAKAETEYTPAEGDLCLNAPKFEENGKWYKRPANPSETVKAKVETLREMISDTSLVEELQSIYEAEYGPIDEKHHQLRTETENEVVADALAADKTLSGSPAAETQQQPRKLSKKEAKAERKAEKVSRNAPKAEDKARQVIEVESDVDLGEELAKYENEHPEAYKFGEALNAPESAEKMKIVIAESLAQDLKTPAPTSTGVQWADPPLYRVLAYDSGNDMMSSATTTTSVFPGSAEERPLGIPEALSQLYQPARFVPYFAELQNDDFQAVAATREVIVFRQVRRAEESKKEVEQSSRSRVGLEDHGLDGSRARLNSDVHKGKESSSEVNPIDGTSRLHPGPTTGNFASPTGFVNHDPVFPPESTQQDTPLDSGERAYSNLASLPRVERQRITQEQQQAAHERARLRNRAKKARGQQEQDEQDDTPETRSDTYSTIAKEPTGKTSRQIWESLPGSSEAPVTRTETVFSGMTRAERQRAAKEQQQAAHERGRLRNSERRAFKAREREWETLGFPPNFDPPTAPGSGFKRSEYQALLQQSRARARGRARKALKYAIGTGMGAGAVMYLVGALVEREREQESERGRGAVDRIAERAMWEREWARKAEAERRRLGDEARR